MKIKFRSRRRKNNGKMSGKELESQRIQFRLAFVQDLIEKISLLRPLRHQSTIGLSLRSSKSKRI